MEDKVHLQGTHPSISLANNGSIRKGYNIRLLAILQLTATPKYQIGVAN
jgi:hypothetical protein